MIISKTPYRISFFGGGTDYPVWYLENSGVVLSATINRYSWISLRNLPQFFEYKNRVRYHENETTLSISEIKHPSVRECAHFAGLQNGLDIVHYGDLPGRSGLGSSSAFTVGLLNAMYSLMKVTKSKLELANDAINVEQNLIKEYVGSQDQMATSVGGFNKIRFKQNGEITLEPINLHNSDQLYFEKHLLLCFSGQARSASEMAKKQIDVTKSKRHELKALCQLTEQAIIAFQQKNISIRDISEILNEQWKIKRSFTDLISNEKIDDLYKTGMAAGAYGGKLLGAGGGGFMLFIAPPCKHEKIKSAIGDKMTVPLKFEYEGSTIVFNSYGHSTPQIGL